MKPREGNGAVVKTSIEIGSRTREHLLRIYPKSGKTSKSWQAQEHHFFSPNHLTIQTAKEEAYYTELGVDFR